MIYCLELSGDIAESLGRRELALQRYRQALQLYPDSPTLNAKVRALADGS